MKRYQRLLLVSLTASLILPASTAMAAAPLIVFGLLKWSSAFFFGAKAVMFSAAAFKSAAIGTAFLVKGIVVKKVALTAITLYTGGVVLNEVVDVSLETLGDLGYQADSKADISKIRGEITQAARENGSYVVKYCTSEAGARIIAQKHWSFCPEDGAAPVEGERLTFDPGVGNPPTDTKSP